MAKLRKMMGELTDPAVVGLMKLIETQSKMTLAAWPARYVKEHYAPILTKNAYTDSHISEAMDAAIGYADGKTR